MAHVVITLCQALRCFPFCPVSFSNKLGGVAPSNNCTIPQWWGRAGTGKSPRSDSLPQVGAGVFLLILPPSLPPHTLPPSPRKQVLSDFTERQELETTTLGHPPILQMS